MFFKKNRVEEDLKKIREANLPNHEEENNSENSSRNSDDLGLEKGDILAMTLAILSLILPYILAFIGIMAAVILLMRFFWS